MAIRDPSFRSCHGIRYFLARSLMADFSSKIRWRMRHDRSQKLITIQDKYLLRKYAEKCDVSMASLLFVGERAEDIPFKDLPESCMIKASHGCGWNIIKQNHEYFYFGNGSSPGLIGHIKKGRNGLRMALRLDEGDVLRICGGWLRKKYSTREWAYHQMAPRILIEEMLFPKSGKELLDYRLYTFEGKVAVINVGSPAYRAKKVNVFFFPDWTLVPLGCNAEPLPEPLPRKPESLPAMINAAGRLGKGIDFARIDFFETTKGVILGEMTVYPEGGKRLSPTSCRCFNVWLGKQWRVTSARELHVWWDNIAFLVGRRLRRTLRALGER